MDPHYSTAFLWHSPVLQSTFSPFPFFGFLCAFLLSHSRVVFPWWSHSTASTLTSPWLTPKPLSSFSPNHMSSCLLASCKSHTGNLKSLCSESNSSPPTILSFPRFNTSPSLLHPNSGSHWNLTVLPPLLPPFSLIATALTPMNLSPPSPWTSSSSLPHPSCTRRMVLVWPS